MKLAQLYFKHSELCREREEEASLEELVSFYTFVKLEIDLGEV
jgi:hypothetical protein